jgi:hypothetical protein
MDFYDMGITCDLIITVNRHYARRPRLGRKGEILSAE